MLFDGTMVLCLAMVKNDCETKIGTRVLRYNVSNSKSTVFKNDTSKIIEYITSTMIIITDQGETHDNLMKETFNAFLMVPRTEFHQ